MRKNPLEIKNLCTCPKAKPLVFQSDKGWEKDTFTLDILGS